MKYAIYIVDTEVDRFDTSFDEVKNNAEDVIFDENLTRLFFEYIKRINDDTVDNVNCFHYLCDEENGVILQG